MDLTTVIIICLFFSVLSIFINSVEGRLDLVIIGLISLSVVVCLCRYFLM